MEHHNDGFDNFRVIPTWDLRKANYDSPYVRFADRELQDHEFQPLDRLEGDELAIVDQYNPRALWPWLYINGQNAASGEGVAPGPLQGQYFDDIFAELQAGEQSQARLTIKAEADLIATYICHGTGGQPLNVCS